MLMLGDMDKDGKLDSNEIAGALTAATGFSVPAFIVSDAMKDFDLNEDGKLDLNEMNVLWTKLGFEVDDNTEYSDDEIDAVLDELDEDAINADETVVEDEITIQENSGETAAEPSTEINLEKEDEVSNQETTESENINHSSLVENTGELSEDIDTEFERLVLEMESARFSSERKASDGETNQ